MANRNRRKKNAAAANNCETKPTNSTDKKDNRSGGYHATYGAKGASEMKVNSPDWYNSNSEQVRAATKINFYWPSGSKVDTSTPASSGNLGPISFPGICRMDLALIPGTTGNPQSAVNYASRTMYMDVRHANSGSTNYDPVDLMMYSIVYSNIYAFHSWLVRVNEILSHYTQTNMYLPRALLTSMGVDPDDLTRNAALFQGYVDTFADRASRLYMPDVLPIFKRHGFVFRHIYHDADSSKAQIYYFNPKGFYTIDETASPAKLVLVSLTPNASYSVIEAYGNNLLEKLFNSQDAGIISGDLLKAYGDEKRIKFEHTEALPKLELKYDPEVLSQIQNATVVGEPDSYDITQDATTGDLIFDPVFSIPSVGSITTNPTRDIMGESRVLNMHVEGTPTADQIMVATRLMAIATDFNTADKFTGLICGSEFVTGMTLFRFATVAGVWTLTSIPFTNCGIELSRAQTATQFDDSFKRAMWSTYWDWLPFFFYEYGSTSTLLDYDYAFDVDVYGIVDPTNLERLHAAALMSEFGAPYNA